MTSIRVYSDYIWPFCYIGKVLADRLGQELNLPVEWLNIEIHPETPPQGRSIRELFPASSVESMYIHLNEMGSQYGLKFSAHDLLSNSRLGILLGDYIHLNAPEHDQKYHEAVFKAYFTESQNISDQAVLANILEQVGLNPNILALAINDPTSKARMQENAHSAMRAQVTGTPTFFIGNERIVGAQPYPSLLAAARRALGSITE